VGYLDTKTFIKVSDFQLNSEFRAACCFKANFVTGTFFLEQQIPKHMLFPHCVPRFHHFLVVSSQVKANSKLVCVIKLNVLLMMSTCFQSSLLNDGVRITGQTAR
jgi:hypothetical protein